MIKFASRLQQSLQNNASVRRFSAKPPNNISKMKGPITFLSLGIMVAAAVGTSVYYNFEKEKKTQALAKNIRTIGKAALGGPWVLVDHDGVPKSDASFRGKFALLYFGFTYCPDICPSELVKVGNIMKELGKFYQSYRFV